MYGRAPWTIGLTASVAEAAPDTPVPFLSDISSKAIFIRAPFPTRAHGGIESGWRAQRRQQETEPNRTDPNGTEPAKGTRFLRVAAVLLCSYGFLSEQPRFSPVDLTLTISSRFPGWIRKEFPILVAAKCKRHDIFSGTTEGSSKKERNKSGAQPEPEPSIDKTAVDVSDEKY